MPKEKSFIISIVVVIAVILLGLIVFGGKKSSSPSPTAQVNKPPAQNQAPSAEYQSPTATKAPDVAVPNETSTNLPANVAKPEIVAPISSGSSSKNRVFEIQVKDGKFIPDTVIVQAGDVVKMNITAVGGNYDFTQPDYGVQYPLPKNKTQLVGFQVTNVGKFTFYCSSCGGPKKGPIGYLIAK